MRSHRRFFTLTLCQLAAFFAVALVAAPSRAVAQGNWAEKMFKEKAHDFRIVGRGTKSEYHFEFRNIYKEDVHVAAVRTSCGCTTPTVTQDTLRTHETAAVVAQFNTSTFVGKKQATVTVVFDRPSYAEVRLKVSGFIRTDITFDPPEVAFGQIKPGEPQERNVTISHSGNSNWEIKDVRSHCDNLRVRLDPPQRTPGMVRYRMTVKVDGKMDEGEIRERLTLISNDRAFPTTEMSISGSVQPMLGISPASVGLNTMSANEVKEKRLVVKGLEPFEIVDIVCADDRIKFEVPTTSKKLHMVKMRFTGDGTKRSVSEQIKIISNLPGSRSATCLVTGSIR